MNLNQYIFLILWLTSGMYTYAYHWVAGQNTKRHLKSLVKTLNLVNKNSVCLTRFCAGFRLISSTLRAVVVGPGVRVYFCLSVSTEKSYRADWPSGGRLRICNSVNTTNLCNKFGTFDALDPGLGWMVSGFASVSCICMLAGYICIPTRASMFYALLLIDPKVAIFAMSAMCACLPIVYLNGLGQVLKDFARSPHWVSPRNSPLNQHRYAGGWAAGIVLG